MNAIPANSQKGFGPLNIRIFLFFFISGFCGLLYQIVWLRMAYISFGVITPVLSVVLSVFMLGLALGSFMGGQWIIRLGNRFKVSALALYGATEFLIGMEALGVPKSFAWGEKLLLATGEMNSLKYLFFSDLIITLTILPCCVLMGVTYPLMMSFLEGRDASSTKCFSYLYLANVSGAVGGSFITAFVLIERFGLNQSLQLAASLNFLISILCVWTCFRSPYKSVFNNTCLTGDPQRTTGKDGALLRPVFIYYLLFLTGFISMAMEVVWVRAFTPVLKTTIYSFASILTVYLLATCAGTFIYRGDINHRRSRPTGLLLLLLSVFSFLPVVMNDPRIMNIISGHRHGADVLMVLLSLIPFCSALGYFTPQLIDQLSLGKPEEAGKAYAVNIAGCIAGPLAASYILLPHEGVRLSLASLAAPFLLTAVLYYRGLLLKNLKAAALVSLAAVLCAVSVFENVSYEESLARLAGSVIRRDYAATVVCAGKGMKKSLFVNGIAITSLTTITKMMVHWPLLFSPRVPRTALVICFGMGTTYRSALSWNIKTTAVELVPSIKEAFGYYFDDASKVLHNPKGAIFIDDGRRFLNRTGATYDVIVIDPPPPVEAAASSLLYSEQFYALIKKHLNQGGILQQWFPRGEKKILQAAARSLYNAFPYVRANRSCEGWGVHFLASMSPLKAPSVGEMLAKMPLSARKDMMEWSRKNARPDELLKKMLSREVAARELFNDDQTIRITDDRPYNEYYFLRRLFSAYPLDHLLKGRSAEGSSPYFKK